MNGFYKAGAVCALCAAAAFGVSDAAFAAPPPPPPGVQLQPGQMWCPRCGGHGRVASGWLGWSSKRCPECRGTGMIVQGPGGHHGGGRPAPAANKAPGGKKGGDRPAPGGKGGNARPR